MLGGVNLSFLPDELVLTNVYIPCDILALVAVSIAYATYGNGHGAVLETLWSLGESDEDLSVAACEVEVHGPGSRKPCIQKSCKVFSLCS